MEWKKFFFYVCNKRRKMSVEIIMDNYACRKHICLKIGKILVKKLENFQKVLNGLHLNKLLSFNTKLENIFFSVE